MICCLVHLNYYTMVLPIYHWSCAVVCDINNNTNDTFAISTVSKRSLCCQLLSIRLYVCLSITFMYSIQMLQILSDFFLSLIAHHSSFLRPSGVPKSKGNPLSGGIKYTGVQKICNFRLKSPFISETV